MGYRRVITIKNRKDLGKTIRKERERLKKEKDKKESNYKNKSKSSSGSSSNNNNSNDVFYNPNPVSDLNNITPSADEIKKEPVKQEVKEVKKQKNKSSSSNDVFYNPNPVSDLNNITPSASDTLNKGVPKRVVPIKNSQGRIIGYRDTAYTRGQPVKDLGMLYPEKIIKEGDKTITYTPDINQSDVDRFNRDIFAEEERIKKGPSKNIVESANRAFDNNPNATSVKVGGWVFERPDDKKKNIVGEVRSNDSVVEEKKNNNFNLFKPSSYSNWVRPSTYLTNKARDVEFKALNQKGYYPIESLKNQAKSVVYAGLGTVSGFVEAVTYDLPKLGLELNKKNTQAFNNWRVLSVDEKQERLKASVKNIKNVPALVGTTAALVVSDIDYNLRERPTTTITQIGANIFGPTLVSKGIGLVNQGFVKVGSKLGLNYVDPTDVFSAETLAYGKLPTTKSSAETIKNFKNTLTAVDDFDDVAVKGAGYTSVNQQDKLKAFHISQAEFGKTGQFMSGPAGQAGVQDTGLFVSSGNRLSPLRIDDGGYSLSFDIGDWFDSFKPKTPKGYNIEFSNIRTTPYNVLKDPGFKNNALDDFYAASVGDETAFVSKRSTIGHGELKPQTFVVEEGFELKGKKTKAGTILRERGTVEEEAIFPEGTNYVFGEKRSNIFQKVLKAEAYTTYNGKTILLTEGKVLPKSNTIIFNNVPKTKGEVLSNTDLLSSSASSSNKIYVNVLPPVNSNFLSSKDKKDIISNASGLSSNVAYSASVSFPKVSFSTSTTSSKSISSNLASSSIVKSSGRSSTSKRSSGSNNSSISDPISSVSEPSSSGGSSSEGYSSNVSIVSNPSSGRSSRSSVSSFSSSIISSITSTPRFTSNFGFSRKSPKQSGFDVFVRRKGKFIKENNKPLKYDQALNFGSLKVKSSSAATFFVKQGFGPLGSFKKNVGLKGIKKKKDKKTGKIVFMEDLNQRIKSSGEKREITLKGIQANKARSKAKKVWGF